MGVSLPCEKYFSATLTHVWKSFKRKMYAHFAWVDLLTLRTACEKILLKIETFAKKGSSFCSLFFSVLAPYYFLAPLLA